MAQIATAWVLSKPGVTAPIIGTTSLKNLEDILGKRSPTGHGLHRHTPTYADRRLVALQLVTHGRGAGREAE